MTLGGSSTTMRNRYATGAFAADPELKDAMAKAGVVGPPRIEISVEA
jgi:hypothetical protein